MNFVPEGIIVPIVTPVTAQGRFNESVYRELIDFFSREGVHGVFPFGTTGEFYAFDDEADRYVLCVTREQVAGRMAIYAGANHITTEGVIRIADIARQEGVDGLSVLTPMFISQTQDELYDHYRAIAQATDLPIVIYNNKPKTNVTVLPQTVQRLAAIPNIAGIKDSTGDMTNTEEYIRLTRGISGFSVLVGHDTLICAGLHYGATGAIASCANVAPGLAVSIYKHFKAGEYGLALEAQFKLAQLRVSTEMGTFPVVIKEGLTMLGFDVGGCLPPIQPLTSAKRLQFQAVLRDIGVLG